MRRLMALLVGVAGVVGAVADCPLLMWNGTTHYFQTGRGDPVFLVGHYFFCAPTYNQEKGDYDLPTYMVICASNHYNFIRLWNIESTGYQVKMGPFPRTGPGNAGDGLLKYDLTTLDTTNYFTRLTNILATANASNIYCSVMLWNGYSDDVSGTRMSTNLHITANNINGHVADTNGVHTLTDSTWAGWMTNYLHAVVDYCNPYPNVFYEIINESSYKSTNFDYSMAQELKSYESGKPNQHPIILSSMSAAMPTGNTVLTNWLISSNVGTAFVPNIAGGIDYNLNPPAVTATYPSIIDTDHVTSSNGMSSNMLKAITRGYAGYWELNPTDNPPNFTDIGPWSKSLGYIAAFLNANWSFATALPSSASSTTGYAITNTYGSWLGATFNKSTFTASSHPSGLLWWKWLDADSGVTSDTGVYWSTGTSDTWALPAAYQTNGLVIIKQHALGPGIEFTGTNSYIDCGSTYTNLMTNNVTFTAWIMLYTNMQSMTYVGPRIISNGGFYFMLNGTALELGNNAADIYSATNAILNAFAWYHCAATRDSSGNYNLYVNGTNSGTVNQNNLGDARGTKSVTIGNEATSLNRGFPGLIWDVQIYNRVLPAAEIKTLAWSKHKGPVNTTSLLAWYPMNGSAAGTAMNNVTVYDKGPRRANATAHTGTGATLTQRLAGMQMISE